jgi:hypothetical protein
MQPSQQQQQQEQMRTAADGATAARHHQLLAAPSLLLLLLLVVVAGMVIRRVRLLTHRAQVSSTSRWTTACSTRTCAWRLADSRHRTATLTSSMRSSEILRRSRTGRATPAAVVHGAAAAALQEPLGQPGLDLLAAASLRQRV